jgi:hypothetical protein
LESVWIAILSQFPIQCNGSFLMAQSLRGFPQGEREKGQFMMKGCHTCKMRNWLAAFLSQAPLVGLFPLLAFFWRKLLYCSHSQKFLEMGAIEHGFRTFGNKRPRADERAQVKNTAAGRKQVSSPLRDLT